MIVSLAFSALRMLFFLEVTKTWARPSFSLVDDGEATFVVEFPSWERRFDAEIETRRPTSVAVGISSEASFMLLRVWS